MTKKERKHTPRGTAELPDTLEIVQKYKAVRDEPAHTYVNCPMCGRLYKKARKDDNFCKFRKIPSNGRSYCAHYFWIAVYKEKAK